MGEEEAGSTRVLRRGLASDPPAAPPVRAVSHPDCFRTKLAALTDFEVAIH
jgi:hypothetical protein